jgi:hypothetical protein
MIMRKMPQIKTGNSYKWLTSIRISKYKAIDFTLVALVTFLFSGIKVETKELYKNHQECLLINGAEAKWLCDSIAYPKSRDDQIREAEQDYNESRKFFPEELVVKPELKNDNLSDDKNNKIFIEQQNKDIICLAIKGRRDYILKIETSSMGGRETKRRKNSDMDLILYNEFNVPFGYCSGYF